MKNKKKNILLGTVFALGTIASVVGGSFLLWKLNNSNLNLNGNKSKKNIDYYGRKNVSGVATQFQNVNYVIDKLKEEIKKAEENGDSNLEILKIQLEKAMLEKQEKAIKELKKLDARLTFERNRDIEALKALIEESKQNGNNQFEGFKKTEFDNLMQQVREIQEKKLVQIQEDITALEQEGAARNEDIIRLKKRADSISEEITKNKELMNQAIAQEIKDRTIAIAEAKQEAIADADAKFGNYYTKTQVENLLAQKQKKLIATNNQFKLIKVLDNGDVEYQDALTMTDVNNAIAGITGNKQEKLPETQNEFKLIKVTNNGQVTYEAAYTRLELDAKYTALEQKLTNLIDAKQGKLPNTSNKFQLIKVGTDGSITYKEIDVDAINQKLQQAENMINQQENRIQSLETWKTTAEQSIQRLENDSANAKVKMSNIENSKQDKLTDTNGKPKLIVVDSQGRITYQDPSSGGTNLPSTNGKFQLIKVDGQTVTYENALSPTNGGMLINVDNDGNVSYEVPQGPQQSSIKVVRIPFWTGQNQAQTYYELEKLFQNDKAADQKTKMIISFKWQVIEKQPGFGGLRYTTGSDYKVLAEDMGVLIEQKTGNVFKFYSKFGEAQIDPALSGNGQSIFWGQKGKDAFKVTTGGPSGTVSYDTTKERPGGFKASDFTKNNGYETENHVLVITYMDFQGSKLYPMTRP